MYLILLLQGIVDGVLMGGIYGIVAMGLTIIFGVIDIINFSHGEFLMVSMYITYILVTTLHLDPYVSMVIVLPVCFVLGIMFWYLVIRPIFHAPHINQLLVTFAAGIILENVALMYFSGDILPIQLSYSYSILKIGDFLIIRWLEVFAFIGCIMSAAFIYWFLKYTNIGLQIRAAAQNRQAALLVGINTYKVYMIAMGTGIGLLGIAGPVLLPIYCVSPSIGSLFTIVAFVVVILGGKGNIIGAFVGGLIVGIIEQIGTVLIDGTFGQMLIFVTFAAIILTRPEGLFTRRKI